MTIVSRSMLYLLGLAAAVVWSSNCALAGFDRNDGSLGGQGGNVGGSGGSVAGGSGGGVCTHAEFPPKPMVSNAGGSEVIEVALRSIDMGENNDTIGADLDRFCTCQGDGPSCVGEGEQCDAVDGRDNALRALFDLVTALFLPDTPSGFYSNQAETGSWTLILVISGYNGQPDDDQVRLEWYVSPGLDDMDPLAEPAWDGTDPWRLSDTNFELDVNGMPDPTMPRFVDDNAYVAGSVLVASLGGSQPEIAFSGTNSFFKLRFTGTTMSATLVPDGNGWKLTEGTIAGRIAEPDLFAAFSSFREGAFFICSDQALYQTTKQAMCAARDIHASIASPATPCDALSFGIGFTADPALRGVISPSADPMPICMPAVDPINDSCALGAGGAGGN